MRELNADFRVREICIYLFVKNRISEYLIAPLAPALPPSGAGVLAMPPYS